MSSFASLLTRARESGKLPVRIKRLSHYAGPGLPGYASSGAVGMDLIASVESVVDVWPGATRLIPTGIAVAIPPGFEMQIRPRSGLALNFGVTVANSPGTIDHDYRGEVCVILLNTGDTTFAVKRGMRIAQAVFAPVLRAELIEVVELDGTERGAGGFGSTGV